MNTLPNDAIPYRESELLRRAITNLPELLDGLLDLETKAPTWITVQHLFDCDKAVARAICRHYKIDPDSQWRADPTAAWNPGWRYIGLDDGK